jgi:hypothetical protein
MITPLLMLFLGVQQDIQAVRGDVSNLREAIERLRVDVKNQAFCSAEAKWLVQNQNNLFADPQKPISLALMSMVSTPNECLPAEVKITANYYDPKGVFVCTGSLSVGQPANVQNLMFEFQPLNLEYFMKWRDGPTWDRSTYTRLNCFDYEGIESRDPGSQSTSVRLFATVLPKRGGLASTEVTLTLPQPPPNRRR